MGLAQSIFQLTDWLVRPMRRVLPGFGGFDWASLLAAVLVALVSVELELLLQSVMSLQILLVLSVVRFAQWILYGFMALLVLEAIFSWVNPNAPFAPFIRSLNAPLLSPLRRLIPPMGGIDCLTGVKPDCGWIGATVFTLVSLIFLGSSRSLY